MSAGEAARRSAWARLAASFGSHALAAGVELRPKGTPPGLFAPAAFERVYGPGATALFVVDGPEPSLTLMCLARARAFRALLGHLLGGASGAPSDTPLDELEAGAAHLAASSLLRAAAFERLRLGVVLTEPRSIRGALGAEVWDFLELELALPGRTHRVDLLCRGRLPGSPPRREASLADVALPVSISAGFTRLTLRELSSIGPGDALVLEDVLEDGVYLDVPGTAARRGARAEGRRIALGPPAAPLPTLPMEHPMSDEITRPLDDAQIEVSAEIARTRMRVGELSRLTEGEVLELGVDVGEEVALRAGDAVVARGELVNVDGRLGVLIRSVGG